MTTTTPTTRLTLDSTDIQVLLGAIWECRNAGLIPANDADADAAARIERRLEDAENRLSLRLAAGS